MNIPRQPFVGLALMAALGIAVADFVSIAPSQWLIWLIALVSIAIVLFWKSNTGLTYLLVGYAFFLLHNFQTGDTPGLRLANELGERMRTVRATGVVASEPRVTANGFATFLFNLDSIEVGGRAERANATISVRWRGNPEVGDELRICGSAGPISPPRNPGEFDMRSYLARRDVRTCLFVRYAEDGVLLKRGAGDPILRTAQRSRAWMQKVICQGLDDSPEVQNFLSGIALGLRHQAPEDIEEPFQQTGTLHLFAVAGLHVGIVARLLWTLAIMVRLPQKWATAIIIPLLLFYAAVTGLHVSSVRAAIMCSILLAGVFAARNVFALNSLASAAFFLLCWDTNEFFSTGFQLSFAVVGGIILLADPLSRWLQKFGETDPFLPRGLVGRYRRVIGSAYKWICRGCSVSLAAWLGSLPLIFAYFHLITPSSVFANLLVVPLAFFILAIALVSLATAPISLTLSVIFNNANWSLASGVIALVHWCAQLSGSHYYAAQPHWPNGVCARITVFDLGAGAAVHIQSAGEDWLLDCGTLRDYERTLRPYLHAVGVNRVDGLLLSHGDSRHIGGASALIADFFPRIVIDNPAVDRSSVHRGLRAAFTAHRTSVSSLSDGECFTVAPNVSGKILFPPRGFSATATDDEALIVQLSVKATKILFMSDSGYATERALISSRVDLQSDILVKGQNHSGNSGLGAFLDVVHPRVIVATSRDFPQHERIPDDWAERVRGRGIKLFRQDETGAVELEFYPDTWRARAFVTGEIFRSDNR